MPRSRRAERSAATCGRIFHQKFIIRDYPAAKPTSVLLAGSANFTHHDTNDNLNNVFVFHDPKVCREYVGEFKRLEQLLAFPRVWLDCSPGVLAEAKRPGWNQRAGTTPS